MPRIRGDGPPPYTGIRIDRIGVVVPANNEEESLPRCIEALCIAAHRVALPVSVIVVLDACTDDSATVIRNCPEREVEALVVDANNVGFARAAGMSELLRRNDTTGMWLATTDSDSVVPHSWFTSQLRYADSGARVVAGTVVVEDWENRSRAVRQRALRAYRAGGHRHVHGANLSFAATAYCAAGGFQPLTFDEDVSLVDALRANDEPIAWATDLPVVTSARREARAPKGFASYLASLERSMESSRTSRVARSLTRVVDSVG